MVQCIGDGDLMYANTLMCVNTLAPPTPFHHTQPTKTNHHPEPEITLCEAESDYKGEGGELR